MTSEAEVTFDMPTRQSRQVGESGDGGVSANNGLYGNLGKEFEKKNNFLMTATVLNII